MRRKASLSLSMRQRHIAPRAAFHAATCHTATLLHGTLSQTARRAMRHPCPQREHPQAHQASCGEGSWPGERNGGG